MDMPKPWLIAQLANLQTTFFFIFYLIKKKVGEGTSMRRSKVTLLFSLTCSVDFFMLGPYRPYNKPTFLALIPPSFTSLNPFVTFFRPFEPHSSSHNWGKYENSRFNSDAFGYIQEMQSRETSGAHKSSRLQMSEENFPTELSRVTFYDYIIYPKL